MHHNKQNRKKKGTKAETVASRSRMDAILEEIDRVISKKKLPATETKAKKVAK